MEPHLDFQRQLGWDMVDNTLDKETESKGVERKQPRARRETLGDHELVTNPKYCGYWLADENKWRRVNQNYQNQICSNRSGDCIFLQGGLADTIRDSYYVLGVMQLMFLMLIPNN